MATDPDIAALADGIADEIIDRRAFHPHADRIGDDLDLAYRVQRAVIERLKGRRADRRVGGYKIAFNRASSMDYYRIGEPCLAPVFADSIVGTGAELLGAAYNELVIEPELIVTLTRDLTDGADRATIMAAMGPVRPGFELMDVRGAFGHDPTAAQAVAQGIYNAGAVVGGPGIAIGALDLARLRTRVAVDGGVVGEAVGAAPQDPVEAVAWLAKTLAARGEQLKSGMIILCGTHLPTRTVVAPAGILVDMAGVGSAEFRLG